MRRGNFGLNPVLAAAVFTVALSTLIAPQLMARSDVELPTAFGYVPDNLYAIRDPNIFTHNVGLLTLQITNVGIIGNPFIDDFSAGWRGGEYLFFSGLWVGAIGSDSDPHVSTASPLELRPELEPVWTVYESFEGVKNGKRISESDPTLADDDGDGEIDEDFHDGLDNDEDGLIDEDFAAIGQQMFSCVYKDDTPEAIQQVSDHYPLGLRINQRSFQWSTTDINEFVGFDFEIINTGDQRLKEVYLAFFSDSDAGPKTAERYWTDDRVGWAHLDTVITDPDKDPPCDEIPVSMDMAYMWDVPDNGTSVTGGDVSGVFGSLFLGHTTDDTGVTAPSSVGLTTVAWFSASGENSDPQNDDERYLLISSGNKPVRNPNAPDDYRYVIAAGPFAQMDPGESLNFQTAYVIGEGETGFRANAVNAQRVFNGRFVNADGNDDTGTGGRERCLFVLPGEEGSWNDPCDTLNTEITFRNTPPCDASDARYVDDDCNVCTGIDGAEQLINWVGTTAPPPPTMNTSPELNPILDPNLTAFVDPAGDRQVILQWDNASELRPDPITGKDIFLGYRVWRVDNWERPEGSIGPSPEEWMKLAEFRKTSRDDGTPISDPGEASEPLRMARNPEPVDDVGTTDDDRPIYPVGYYQYVDNSGIINGKLYFYAVTAFGEIVVNDAATGETTFLELSGLPSAVEAESVVPRWDSQAGCEGVRVVPNPYRGGAEWDLIPSETDPTGTKIGFRNLPDEKSTIRIYTLAGDLVQEADHPGGEDGTYFWNLVSRNGQNVVSGVYLYSVEYSGGTCRGRFVIIR